MAGLLCLPGGSYLGDLLLADYVSVGQSVGAGGATHNHSCRETKMTEATTGQIQDGIREHLIDKRKMTEDNWEHRTANMRCRTCIYFVVKKRRREMVEEAKPERTIGRCRRNAPTMKGWPVMFADDWCGEHKLDENKV